MPPRHQGGDQERRKQDGVAIRRKRQHRQHPDAGQRDQQPSVPLPEQPEHEQPAAQQMDRRPRGLARQHLDPAAVHFFGK